ncbi:hypothetical protein ES703_13271 [subsurface metagenome]
MNRAMPNFKIPVPFIFLFLFLILIFVSAEGILQALENVKEVALTNQQEKETSTGKLETGIQNARVNMKLALNKRDFHFPEPITIQIFLYKLRPISGAKVTASITSPAGKIFNIPFSENVLLGPTLPESGSYVGIVTDLEEDGQYQVIIQANDNNGNAHYAKPFVGNLPEKQKIIEDKPQREPVGSFKTESMITINAFGYAGKAGLPPLKVTTLYASIDSDQCVHLFWQVPINIGRNGGYEIRYSSKSITSKNAWDEARLSHEGKYISKAGETQEHKICDLGKGTYYFAVKSVNSKGFQSEISNDYIVVIK